MPDTKDKETSLYYINLYLPARCAEEDVQTLAENCGTDILAILTDLEDKNGELVSQSGGTAKHWRVRWMVETVPDFTRWAAGIAYMSPLYAGLEDFSPTAEDFFVESLPEINWLEKNREEFRPFYIGDFLICGSDDDELPPHHSTCSRDLPGQEAQRIIPIRIDAATAFGTGRHPTTRGCLLALLEQERKSESGELAPPSSILDMGTGSGILAIAAARLWPLASITAVDNDAESVEVADYHCRVNQVSSVTASHGDGFSAVSAKGGCQTYDLILANILAPPLREMASDMATSLAEGGSIILSGLLVSQVDGIREVYAQEGLELTAEKKEEDWSTLVLRRVRKKE